MAMCCFSPVTGLTSVLNRYMAMPTTAISKAPIRRGFRPVRRPSDWGPPKYDMAPPGEKRRGDTAAYRETISKCSAGSEIRRGLGREGAPTDSGGHRVAPGWHWWLAPILSGILGNLAPIERHATGGGRIERLMRVWPPPSSPDAAVG